MIYESIRNDSHETNMPRESKSSDEERSISSSGSGASYGTHSIEESGHIMPSTNYNNDYSTTIGKLKYGGRTSVMAAVFITMNAIIGSAYLNLPYATKAFNLATLLWGQLPIVVISTFILLVLAKAIEKTQKITFQDIMESLFGLRFKKAIDIILICYCFSTCVSYMMVVKDQAVTLIQWFVNLEHLPAAHLNIWDKIIAAVTCLVTIYPLCIPRRVNFLYYPSVASFFANLYVLVFVMQHYFFVLEEEHRPVNLRAENFDLSDIVNFTAVIIFQFQSFYSSPAIYSDLRKRSTANWLTVAVLANFGSYIIYTLLAVFALLTFGEQVDEDFLNSYDVKDPLAILARASIMVSIVSAYPILCFVACKVIGDIVFSKDESQNNSSRLSFPRYISIKTIFFLTSLLCMLFAPGMTQVFVLAGILASFSTLALPGILMMRIHTEYSLINGKIVFSLGIFFILVNLVFIVGYIYSVVFIPAN